VGEACTAIVAKPARAVITSLGTLLGVAWFVTALGLASTAGADVTSAFAQRLPTQVRISPKSTKPEPSVIPYPRDVERRLAVLRGVVAAGVYGPLRLGRPLIVSTLPQPAAGGAASGGGGGGGGGGAASGGEGGGGAANPSPGAASRRPPVLAASPGFLVAA